jgi:hypothetical protein
MRRVLSRPCHGHRAEGDNEKAASARSSVEENQTDAALVAPLLNGGRLAGG